MIYPSVSDLSKDGKYNRYTLVIATSKCARVLTDEYVKQREYAEKLIANKATDKSLISMIKKEYRDEKAVKNAIKRLHEGEFAICAEGEEPACEETAETDVTVGEDVSAEVAEALSEGSAL